MNKLSLRSISGVALFAASTLVLAACGGEGGSTTGAPSGSAPTKATTSAKPPASTPSAAKKDPAPSGPMFKAKMMGTDMSKPLVETSLEKANMKGLTIIAPEGAEVTEGKPGGGAHVVAAGVNYSIAIREQEFKLEDSKKVYTSLDPDGKFLSEAPDLVIFQRKSGSVLFAMGLKVDGKNYQCSSVATASDFDKETIDQTIASCKTLKAGGAAPATSASAAPSAAPSASAAPK